MSIFHLVGFLLLAFGRLCAAQSGALYTLPHNFTLAAVNTTLPNANTTGVPLVLGQAGATAGITFHVTSTYASFPYNSYPYLGLVEGGLRAYTAGGWWGTNGTAVQSGGPLSWITSTLYKSNAPAMIYSAVKFAPVDQYSLLAAHGFHDLWSLCPFSNSRQTNVVFNASKTTISAGMNYDPSLCYPIRINIIPTTR